ncbi:MAG: hypothetical protein HUU06_00705 [Planctomycetaceae bacterium]|nr:hypothetical protein [Planctomycetota bacterium]NUN51292.1 hypothetical protein [Planctomycetaceae bacterium]
MRKAAATVAFLALAGLSAAGCKALGLNDVATKDYSGENTKDGAVLDLPAPQRVVVQSVVRDFKSVPAKVKVTLKNEGDLYDIFSADVEIAYPAPPESFAPYIPEFVALDIPSFGKGETKTVEVSAPASATGTPYYAKILASGGKEGIRMTTARENSQRGTRQGTLLLAGKVEVVKMESTLATEKPTLAFTIENVSGEEIGNLRYMVQFYKDRKPVELGRRLSGIRPVGQPLGKKGSQVRIEIAGLDGVAGLSGAMPVLRLLQ